MITRTTPDEHVKIKARAKALRAERRAIGVEYGQVAREIHRLRQRGSEMRDRIRELREAIDLADPKWQDWLSENPEAHDGLRSNDALALPDRYCDGPDAIGFVIRYDTYSYARLTNRGYMMRKMLLALDAEEEK